MLYTIPDYGLTWDAWEYYVGDKNLNFYLTLDSDYLDYKIDNVALYGRPGHPDFFDVTQAFGNEIDVFAAPHLIWPFGHTSSSITKYIFFDLLNIFDPIDAHHIILIAYGILLIVALFKFAAAYIGQWAAVVTVCCLVLYPRYWAHLHNNLKDIPVSVWFSITIILFYHGIVSRHRSVIILAAVAWGIGLATKANMLFVPPILLIWLLFRATQRYGDSQGRGIRKWCEMLLYQSPASNGNGGQSLLCPLLLFPFVGLLCMFLCWPFLLTNFPTNIELYVTSLFERGTHDHSDWNWWPLKNFFTTIPIVILLLLVLGLLRIGIDTIKNRRLDDLHFLLLLWAFIPILRVTIPGARDFDVIRHWLECIPAVALIAGLGYMSLMNLFTNVIAKFQEREYERPSWGQIVAAKSVFIVIIFAPIVVWNIRAHPNNLVFYNSLIGGLEGAQRLNFPEATDYWGSSYRQGFDWLYAQENIPEGSDLYVGVAEHIAFYTRESWLRSDMKLQSFVGISRAQFEQNIENCRGHVYVMYITRKSWYTRPLTFLDQTQHVAFQITVDGGVILKIIRLK